MMEFRGQSENRIREFRLPLITIVPLRFESRQPTGALENRKARNRVKLGAIEAIRVAINLT